MSFLVNPFVFGNAPISVQHWRLRFPDGSTGEPDFVGTAEIEFRATVGGADLTSTGGASASSTDTGNAASDAFDNTLGAADVWFCASGQDVNAWIANDLGSPTDLEEIVFYGYSDGITNPATIVVEYSENGSAWTEDTRWPALTGLAWDAGPSSGSGEIKKIRRTGLEVPEIINIAGLPSLSADNGGWNNFTLRQVLTAAVVPGPGGNRCRISFRAGNAEGLSINKCYIGIKGAGSYDFSDTPVQVLFNGGSSTASVSAATTQMSDDITLTIGASEAITVSVYISGAADTFRRASAITGVTGAFKSGDSAASVTVTGYTANNFTYLDDLEVWSV